jgi:hypothetical protein
VERLPKNSWLWAAPRSPGKTMGSSCLRWLKSQRTTKLASEEVACWAEATGAFHHISVATQAAAAATPKTNMSAKWTCHQARWLLGFIFLPLLEIEQLLYGPLSYLARWPTAAGPSWFASCSSWSRYSRKAT